MAAEANHSITLTITHQVGTVVQANTVHTSSGLSADQAQALAGQLMGTVPQTLFQHHTQRNAAAPT